MADHIEELGYLRGKVESLESKMDQHMAHEAQYIKLLSEDIAFIKERLNMYKHFLFFIRTILAMGAAALALNWEGARDSWLHFISPPQ